MASGNHAINGYCALLVIAATVIMMAVIDEEYIISLHIFAILQCPWDIIKAIAIRRRASPTRFVSAVIIPLFSDCEF